MKVRPDFVPRSSFHATGSVFGHPALNLGRPSFLDTSVTVVLKALEKKASELCAITRSEFGSFLVQIANSPAHRAHFTAAFDGPHRKLQVAFGPDRNLTRAEAEDEGALDSAGTPSDTLEAAQRWRLAEATCASRASGSTKFGMCEPLSVFKEVRLALLRRSETCTQTKLGARESPPWVRPTTYR